MKATLASITLAAALILGAATVAEGTWCSCWCEGVGNVTPQGAPLCEGSGWCCTGMRPGLGGREGCRCLGGCWIRRCRRSSSASARWPVTGAVVPASSWLDGVRQGEQATVEGRRLVTSGGATAAVDQGIGEVRVPAGVVLQRRGHLVGGLHLHLPGPHQLSQHPFAERHEGAECPAVRRGSRRAILVFLSRRPPEEVRGGRRQDARPRRAS